MGRRPFMSSPPLEAADDVALPLCGLVPPLLLLPPLPTEMLYMVRLCVRVRVSVVAAAPRCRQSCYVVLRRRCAAVASVVSLLAVAGDALDEGCLLIPKMMLSIDNDGSHPPAADME